VDVTRTVGWFTSVVPVWMEVWEGWEPGAGLRSVKEQLRGVPGRGVGYGMLRYLCAEEGVRGRLAEAWEAQMSFNYLGQLDQVIADSSLYDLAHESVGPVYSERDRRKYLLVGEGRVIEGRLQLSLEYSTNVHRAETIERLADTYMEVLRAIIEHCTSPDAGGFTPSDFPLASLEQEELDLAFGSVEFED
jgi:non-ribosomal peptide synthase protein (TIGR01720 family)